MHIECKLMILRLSTTKKKSKIFTLYIFSLAVKNRELLLGHPVLNLEIFPIFPLE